MVYITRRPCALVRATTACNPWRAFLMTCKSDRQLFPLHAPLGTRLAQRTLISGVPIMATRKSRAKSPGRATLEGQGQVGSATAMGTTVSGPSHPAQSLTELADHAAEQQMLAESVP